LAAVLDGVSLRPKSVTVYFYVVSDQPINV